MSDGRSLMPGLARVAASQAAVAAVVAAFVIVLVPTPARDGAIAGVAVVLAAMGIGFVPLRVLLRPGPEQIVAGWVAAMIVRMVAALVGLVLLIRRYRLDVAACVWAVCGVYLLLLIVEAIGLARLIRSEFERTAVNAQAAETDD